MNFHAMMKEYKTVDISIAIFANSFIQPYTAVTYSTFGCNPDIAMPMLLQWIHFNTWY